MNRSMTITITVDEEKDGEYLRTILDGIKWRSVVQSLDEWLRCEIKYRGEIPRTMEDVRKFLYDAMADEGLRLRD